uniref:contractile injection system tape measure protein n=1 Tax=Ralstonia sp. ASV6 TaxID=2795124 RepID=UPI0018EB9277
MTTPLQQGAAGMRHAIETLQWNSRGMSDREHAHAHQARLSAFLNGPGLRTIERVFSRLSPPGEVWQLDSLEIDTGPMQADGSFAQWSEVLEHQLWNTLWRARHEQGRTRPAGVLSADDHALEHFLYYLQHGHLPWARSTLAGRELSAWLARLARRTGAALWTRLRQLQPADYVEARLSQIAPCEGLQALLAVRHRELADSLDSLDAQLLAPLQARGRLSAYQVRQLRQRWRVAGFRVLWAEHAGSLGADALRRLQRELGPALAMQLGRGGFGTWRPQVGEGKEFGQRLLLGVLDVVASTSGQHSDATEGADAMTTMPRETDGNGTLLSSAEPSLFSSDAAGTDPSTRLDTDWQRICTALDGRHPLDAPALRALLRGMRLHDAERVRARLRVEGLRHQSRQAWFERLGAETVWEVMQATAANVRVVGESPAAAGASWAESLRQFALAALAGGEQPGGGRKAGLSALQAWLADYCLREWLLGGQMPRDPRGWRLLWSRALAEWRGQTPATVISQGGQVRERRAAKTGASRLSQGEHNGIGAYTMEIDEADDAAERLRQTVGGQQRTGAVRQADRTPPSSLSAHEMTRSTNEVSVASLGPTLSERYVRAMRELAAQSRAVPPSALFARWRARLRRFVEAQPDGLGVAHFAASRDMWRSELAGDGTPAEAAHMVGATSASLPPQSRLLARWLDGAASPGSAAAWATLLRTPDRLHAALLPRVRRRAWRVHVARHWTITRKLELLVLIDAAKGHECLTHWQAALERWQWLPRAIAACTIRPAPSDRATINRLQKAWLWETTLQWAAEPGLRSVDTTAEGDLFAYWLCRLGEPTNIADAGNWAMSLPATTDAVRDALQRLSIRPGLRFGVATLPRLRVEGVGGVGAAPARTMRTLEPRPDSPTAVSRRSQAGEGRAGGIRHRTRAVTPSP